MQGCADVVRGAVELDSNADGSVKDMGTHGARSAGNRAGQEDLNMTEGDQTFDGNDLRYDNRE